MNPCHEVRAEVGGWVIHFLTLTGHTDLLDVIRVEWNGRFTARVGDATYSPAVTSKDGKTAALVRFSIPLWERAPHAERRNTVAHELAHIIVYHEWYTDVVKRWGPWPPRSAWRNKPKPHGWEWERVMRAMGEKPERCHDIDRTGIKRKVRRVKAVCDCRVHNLTPRKAKKMTCLYCRVCKSPLRRVVEHAAKGAS